MQTASTDLKHNLALLASLFLMFTPKMAYSETVWLPKKMTESVLSVSILEDSYTGVEVTSNDHLLGSLSSNFPILAFESKDQLVASAQVLFDARYGGTNIYAENLDVRVSMYYSHLLKNHLILRYGLTHTSGHVMDDVKETALIPLNMGSDSLSFRIANDGANPFRYGIYANGFLDTDPTGRTINGGIFGEYYFSNNSTDSFFIAQNISLPENLRISVGTASTFGYAYKTLRVVAGYAQGADPRLKHQLYLNYRANYFYGGLRIEM